MRFWNYARRPGQLSRPGSVWRAVDTAEARITRKHDRLIAVFDANLVEDSTDMIADGLCRQTKRTGDLRIIEAFGDTFKHCPFARRQFIQWQSFRGGHARTARLSEKPPHLGDQLRPSWLVREGCVVFAVKLDEAAVGNEACEQSACFNWYD